MERENNKTCLVTGGAGFIGSWLCEELLGRGHGVVCVDDFSSGRERNVEEMKENKKFRFIKHNVINPLKVDGAVDYVFHLASRASPIDYQGYPVHTMLTNGVGTYNMLELARRKKARFLFSSTSEAYGDPQEHPQKETYWGHVNPIGIRSCYDESKRFGEAITMTFMRKHKTDVRITRIFNTYGPRMKADDGRVVSNFVNQAISGEPLTVYGTGEQTRSFCYVSDMVEGLLRQMFSDGEGITGEVINIGNPEEYSIIEFARRIKKMTESESEIVFRDLPEDDPKKRNPDISKAKKLLGWEPEVGLEEGLDRTIRYFKENRE